MNVATWSFNEWFVGWFVAFVVIAVVALIWSQGRMPKGPRNGD